MFVKTENCQCKSLQNRNPGIEILGATLLAKEFWHHATAHVGDVAGGVSGKVGNIAGPHTQLGKYAHLVLVSANGGTRFYVEGKGRVVVFRNADDFSPIVGVGCGVSAFCHLQEAFHNVLVLHVSSCFQRISPSDVFFQFLTSLRKLRSTLSQ